MHIFLKFLNALCLTKTVVQSGHIRHRMGKNVVCVPIRKCPLLYLVKPVNLPPTTSAQNRDAQISDVYQALPV